MGPLLEVLDLRRLPQPEVPVEAVRHRHRLERPLAQARGQIHRDLRELADAAVAHQLAGQAEQLVAPLLRAGLSRTTFSLRTAFTSRLPSSTVSVSGFSA